MKRPIEECWKVYADGILPPDAMPEKRQALRASFYCGVYSLRQLLARTGQGDSKEEGKRKFLAIIDQVDAELHEFIEWTREKAAQQARERAGEGNEKETH
jgi:uncharacterized protein YaiL (DUF2058 family)